MSSERRKGKRTTRALYGGEIESLGSTPRRAQRRKGISEQIRDGAPVLKVLANNEKFHRIDVVINVNDIRKGEFKVRDTREWEPTVNEFAIMFRAGKYALGDNAIRIAILDLPSSLNKELETWARSAPRYVYKGETLAGPNLSELLRGQTGLSRDLRGKVVVYVDGMHRGAALQQDDVKKVLPWPRVHLHIRKDYEPTTQLDIVVAGSQYNQESSATVKMTVVDRINSLVSILCAMEQVARKGNPLPGFDGWDTTEKRKAGPSHKEQRLELLRKSLTEGTPVDSNVLVAYCTRNGWGFGVGVRQISRYCKVACRIYFYKDEIRNLINLAQRLDLPLYVITLPVVWNTSNVTEQKFVLEALRRLLNTVKSGGSSNKNTRMNRRSKKRSCRTEKNYTRLNNEAEVTMATHVIKSLWRSVTAFVQCHKVPVDQVPSWKIAVTPGSPRTHTLYSHLLQEIGSIDMESLMAYSDEDDICEEWVESICKYVEENSDLPALTESGSDSDYDSESQDEDEGDSFESEASSDTTKDSVDTADNANDDGGDSEHSRPASPSSDVPDSSAPVDSAENAASQTRKASTTSENSEESNDNHSDVESADLDEQAAAAALHKRLHEEDIANQNDDNDNPSIHGDGENLHFAKGFRHNAQTHSKAIVKMPPASVSTNEEADINGFQIVRRSPILRENGEYIYGQYNPPHMRVAGFLNTRSLPTTRAYDDDEGIVHEGEFIELGTRIHMNVTQYNDKDDGCGLIRADFKLSTNLRDASPEWLYSRQMEATTEDSQSYEKHDPQLILRAMGLRPPHRSFLALPRMGVHNVRRALVGALAHVFRTEIGASGNHEPILQFIDHVRCQLILHFKGLRAKLDDAGYVVIPWLYEKVGDQANHENPIWAHSKTGESSRKKHDDFVELIQNLFRHMASLLPTHDQVIKDETTEEQARTWACVRNTAYPGEAVIANHSRLMSRRPAITRDFEWPYRGETSEDLVCGKAYLELSVMQIATWLRLEFAAYHEHASLENKKDNYVELSCLDTGGRFLSFVGEDAARQVGHLDEFAPENVQLNSKNGSLLKPSYFALVTGMEGSPLWVAQGSHCYIGLSKKEQTAIAKTKRLSLIRIPPWSLFIGRSDCVHAGAGGQDAFGRQCLRFHMYLHRANMVIADAINSEIMKHYKYDIHCENLGPDDNICYM